ncbi:flap endonuclease-1 [Candidatus Woesearchaeota archaeon]|nr:flap endonuclease-1 [Candidatus Woesearchaeota archaeon]
MGVNITELLPVNNLKWEALTGKIVAVDAYNVLYQFLSSIRQRDGTSLMDSQGRVTSHLVGIFSRFTNLLNKGIKPCIVFDGKPPELKLMERERRRKLKHEAKEKYEEAKQEENLEGMYKYSKRLTFLNEEMINESKELIKAMGMPVIQAPSEAEAQAAFMCKKNDVWAVASQDADTLLFGAQRLVRNLTLSEKRRLGSGSFVYISPEIIELKEVLGKLGITHDQLIVLGILIGTDFNIGGIKGIGPRKALQLVQSGKKFETIFKELNADFDWQEVFDLFKKIPTTEDYNLDFKKVDAQKIRELLIEEHDFSEERVESTLKKIFDEKEKAKQAGLNEWFK